MNGGGWDVRSEAGGAGKGDDKSWLNSRCFGGSRVPYLYIMALIYGCEALFCQKMFRK